MKPTSQHIPLDRRSFLRSAATGVVVGLPFLEAMSRNSRSVVNAGEIADDERPRRSVFTFWGLGMNGRDYTPKETGRDYQLTPILQPLAPHRDDLTVISGLKLTHSGGHGGDRTFLTGTATHAADTKLRVSADQELAEIVGGQTRFPSLQLGVRRGTGFGAPQDNTLSWTRSGTPLPAENRPHVLFDKLFRPDTPESLAQREQSFARQQSVLDSVREEARRLSESLGKNDRQKLEEYFTSIRDLEKRMAFDQQWLYQPKPQVDPIDFGDEQGLDPDKTNLDYRRYQRLMFDVIALALQTDSTRVISYMARKDNSDGTGAYRKETNNPYGYHTMTHHGEDPDKLKWWTIVDTHYMEEWAYFLDRMKSVKEGTGNLLDHTLVAWGSSGGTINAHNNHHLPTMLCGGSRLGVKHQGHLIREDNYLGNLWQTMFGVMGAPTPDNFQDGEADGVITELV
ncbi:DUF1552 domain-containing protein [Lignipirellula cremea]|uniref:DUF1552 domain-containing protein n=1 Tax=Lignipirellula cremea TaxID=2528010 RepID=A0A518DRK4_9BACT|nr:DUF1552 domain-containing protein [Lignipirellula cremea]QDU94453.1 hypothetical protein Pla8534_22440 [Lignipirellula cremea]